MYGPVGKVKQPRLGGVATTHLTDHRQGLVGEVVSEVVVVGVVVHVDDVIIFVKSVGLVEVCEPVKEPVVAVEPPLAGPGGAGSGLGEAVVRAKVPFTDHQGRPATVPEGLGHGYRVITYGRRIPREARVRVTDGGHAGHVRVEAGEQGSPGRRAHRVDVKVGVAQPLVG